MFLSHHQVDKLVFDTSRLSKLVQVFFLLIQVVLGFIGVVLVAFGCFELFSFWCRFRLLRLFHVVCFFLLF